MGDREAFKNDVSAIAAESRSESLEKIRRLKTLSPEEFARLPRRELERLTEKQWREVVRTVAPDLPPTTRSPAAEREAVATDRKAGRRRSSFSALVVSVVISIAVPLVMPTILSLGPLIRGHDTLSWPRCHRLDRKVDGCLYYPSANLSWDYAASMIGVAKDALLANNRHLPPDYAPARQPIVVWRGLGTLE